MTMTENKKKLLLTILIIAGCTLLADVLFIIGIAVNANTLKTSIFPPASAVVWMVIFIVLAVCATVAAGIFLYPKIRDFFRPEAVIDTQTLDETAVADQEQVQLADDNQAENTEVTTEDSQAVQPVSEEVNDEVVADAQSQDGEAVADVQSQDGTTEAEVQEQETEAIVNEQAQEEVATIESGETEEVAQELKEDESIAVEYPYLLKGKFTGSRKIRLVRTMIDEAVSPSFNEVFTMEEFCEDFIAYADRNNVTVTKNLARNIFSALASSRLISLYGEDLFIGKLAQLIAGYFGYELFMQEAKDNWSSHDDLIVEEQNLSETDFACGVYASLFRPEFINMVALYNVDPAKIDKYFKKFQPYVKSPSISYSMQIGAMYRVNGMRHITNGEIALPNNLWVLMLHSSSKQKQLPYIFAKYATIVDTDESYVVSEGEQQEQSFASGAFNVQIKDGNVLSYEKFSELVDDITVQNNISLEGWKRIDKIESFAKLAVDFRVDNRTFRQMERFASVYEKLGGEEIDALDSVIAYKLLPILANYSKLKQGVDEKKWSELLDELFGAGNCPRSQKMIERLGLC